jgi:hypothetical protein
MAPRKQATTKKKATVVKKKALTVGDEVRLFCLKVLHDMSDKIDAA